MIISIDDVTQTVRDVLTDNPYSFNVLRVGIFGSVARGDATDDSDIDLLIDYVHEDGSLDFLLLCDRLRSVFRENHKKEISLIESAALAYRENYRIGKEIEEQVVWVWEESRV